MTFTSPPWQLANRLDQTRRIRLAGDWAVQYRMVFDYSLTDALAGLITEDTLIATCNPNRSVTEFSLPRDLRGRPFPIQPINLDRQRHGINRLIGTATDAGGCDQDLTTRSLRAGPYRPATGIGGGHRCVDGVSSALMKAH